MSSPSIPPVLNPEIANSLAVRRAQKDLDTLMHVAAMRRRAKPVTTISSAERPSVVGAAPPVSLRVFEITACILLPALNHAARIGIARVQEATEEKFK